MPQFIATIQNLMWRLRDFKKTLRLINFLFYTSNSKSRCKKAQFFLFKINQLKSWEKNVPIFQKLFCISRFFFFIEGVFINRWLYANFNDDRSRGSGDTMGDTHMPAELNEEKKLESLVTYHFEIPVTSAFHRGKNQNHRIPSWEVSDPQFLGH